MALPTIEKTWQFNVNRVVGSAAGLAVNKQLLLDMKNMLIAGGGLGTWTNAAGGTISPVNAWTVGYSCNSVTAGTVNDGVDRWTTVSNVVNTSFTSPGVHSWIVLKSTTLDAGGNFQLLIDWVSDDTTSGTYGTFAMYLSRTAGFTGGTTSARPTATDEIFCGQGHTGAFHATGTYGPTFGNVAGSADGYALHCMTSTDGKSYRLIVTRGNTASFILALEQSTNSPAGWTVPIYVIHASSWAATYSSGDVFSGTDEAAHTAFKYEWHVTAVAPVSGKYKMYLAQESLGLGSAGYGSFVPPRGRPYYADHRLSSLSGDYLITQIDVVSVESNFTGRMGYVTDMWACSAPSASTFPAAGAKTYAQLGSIMVPWNTTTPTT